MITLNKQSALSLMLPGETEEKPSPELLQALCDRFIVLNAQIPSLESHFAEFTIARLFDNHLAFLKHCFQVKNCNIHRMRAAHRRIFTLDLSNSSTIIHNLFQAAEEVKLDKEYLEIIKEMAQLMEDLLIASTLGVGERSDFSAPVSLVATPRSWSPVSLDDKAEEGQFW